MKTTTETNNKMAFDMYPSISGKTADPVREVVMKYIDYFLPDASGTSAVAIDNKIEQAMDLVKSHLMIAVREEVEVLKEKISELMDKINQLEVENTILKSNMSQETLQKLQMQTQLQIAGSAPTPAIQAAPTAAAATTTAAAATNNNNNNNNNNNATNVANSGNVTVATATNGGAPTSLNNSATNSAAGTGTATAASTPTGTAVENALTTTNIVSGTTEAENVGAAANTAATVTTTNGPLS